jgi:hypothetical protein
MSELSVPGADRKELSKAIGSLIWKDPERILDAASMLRGSAAVIECQLRGGSMGVAIPAGASLRIDLGTSASHRIGEIVAFVQDSGICVHRIAYLGRGSRSSDYIITQGDACFYPDPPINSKRVLGSVTEFRIGENWIVTGIQPSHDRARSIVGRFLLKLVAGLMEVNVRLAQGVARILRVRKEGPRVVDA